MNDTIIAVVAVIIALLLFIVVCYAKTRRYEKLYKTLNKEYETDNTERH